jgi:hypothetical protein
MLDVFNNSAFGIVPLTDMINKLKYVPSRISSMGLFTASSVSTTAIAIEERNGILVLVPPTPRGGPGVTLPKTKRGIRLIQAPHFEINDAIMAEEVQGVRAWGQETAVETVMGKVAERGVIHAQSMAATEEFSRVGAIKGVITYADGTTTNLFNEFNVTAPTDINFHFDNTTPVAGALRAQAAAIYRIMAASLEGTPYDGVHAMVGDAFFDALIQSPEVRSTYLQQQEAAQLRGGYVDSGRTGAFGTFVFGGIVWENYRGKVGNTDFIGTDEAHFFPTGVPGLFRTVYAPADYIDTVNKPGQRLYLKQWRMENDKGINLDTQMNALSYCTRPNVLIKGVRA